MPADPAGDLPSTPPGIGELEDNGGAGRAPMARRRVTHALPDASAALDVADPAGCPNPVDDDQRGQPVRGAAVTSARSSWPAPAR